MFTNPIMGLLESINDMIIGLGSNSLLTQSLAAFSSDLYNYSMLAMNSVIKPIAYVILALFFTLELYNASIKVEGAGGGSQFGAEIIFRVLFKMVLCKVAVDFSTIIMDAIYSISLEITTGISGLIGSGSTSGGLKIDEIRVVVEAMEWGDQLLSLLIIFITWLIASIIIILVNVIVIARFIEIYIHLIVAPIPLATFPSAELSSIAKNFLKSFAASCIQGCLIFIALSFFTVLFNSQIMGEIGSLGLTGVSMSLLGYTFVLGVAVFSCGKWAKSIFNAM